MERKRKKPIQPNHSTIIQKNPWQTISKWKIFPREIPNSSNRRNCIKLALTETPEPNIKANKPENKSLMKHKSRQNARTHRMSECQQFDADFLV